MTDMSEIGKDFIPAFKAAVEAFTVYIEKCRRELEECLVERHVPRWAAKWMARKCPLRYLFILTKKGNP